MCIDDTHSIPSLRVSGLGRALNLRIPLLPEPTLFFAEQTVNFANQLYQAVVVFDDRSLRTEVNPAFFHFALHGGTYLVRMI